MSNYAVIKRKWLRKLEDEYNDLIKYLKDNGLFYRYCKEMKKYPNKFYRIQSQIQERREEEEDGVQIYKNVKSWK